MSSSPVLNGGPAGNLRALDHPVPPIYLPGPLHPGRDFKELCGETKKGVRDTVRQLPGWRERRETVKVDGLFCDARFENSSNVAHALKNRSPSAFAPVSAESMRRAFAYLDVTAPERRRASRDNHEQPEPQ